MKYTIDSDYAKSNFIIEGTTLVNYIGEPEPEELYIPDGVVTIGEGAFSKIGKIGSIYLPASLKYVGRNNFSDYRAASNVYVEDLDAYYNLKGESESEIVDSWGTVIPPLAHIFARPHSATLYANGEPVRSFSFPEGEIATPPSVFSGFESISELTLPESLKDVSYYSFSFTNIKKIELPNGLTRIGRYAFVSTALESLTVPGTVKVIEEGAFFLCQGIKKITLADGLEEIRDLAFGDTSITEIVIPETVSYVGLGCFKLCRSLKTIYVKGNKKRIKLWHKKWKSECGAKVKFI